MTTQKDASKAGSKLCWDLYEGCVMLHPSSLIHTSWSFAPTQCICQKINKWKHFFAQNVVTITPCMISRQVPTRSAWPLSKNTQLMCPARVNWEHFWELVRARYWKKSNKPSVTNFLPCDRAERLCVSRESSNVGRVLTSEDATQVLTWTSYVRTHPAQRRPTHDSR